MGHYKTTVWLKNIDTVGLISTLILLINSKTLGTADQRLIFEAQPDQGNASGATYSQRIGE
jgi:hypothetical protein